MSDDKIVYINKAQSPEVAGGGPGRGFADYA
jgi:hypothetical protein